MRHVLEQKEWGSATVMHCLCLRCFWNSTLRASTSMKCKLPHRGQFLRFVQQALYPAAVYHKQKGYLWLQSWLPSKLLNAQGSRRMCSCRVCGFFALCYSKGWRLSVRCLGIPTPFVAGTGYAWAAFCARPPWRCGIALGVKCAAIPFVRFGLWD